MGGSKASTVNIKSIACRYTTRSWFLRCCFGMSERLATLRIPCEALGHSLYPCSFRDAPWWQATSTPQIDLDTFSPSNEPNSLFFGLAVCGFTEPCQIPDLQLEHLFVSFTVASAAQGSCSTRSSAWGNTPNLRIARPCC